MAPAGGLAARLIALRRAHPVLRRRAFFSGRPHHQGGLRDLAWFTADGTEMTEQDWYTPGATLGMYLSGNDISQRDDRGIRIVDDSFLAVLHAADRPRAFTLPGPPWAAPTNSSSTRRARTSRGRPNRRTRRAARSRSPRGRWCCSGRCRAEAGGGAGTGARSGRRPRGPAGRLRGSKRRAWPPAGENHMSIVSAAPYARE